MDFQPTTPTKPQNTVVRPLSLSPKKRPGSPIVIPRKRGSPSKTTIRYSPVAFRAELEAVPAIRASTEEWEDKAGQIRSLAKSRKFSHDWYRFLKLHEDELEEFGRQDPLERKKEDYERIAVHNGVVKSYINRLREGDTAIKWNQDLQEEIKEPRFLAEYGDYIKLVLNRVKGSAIMAPKPKPTQAGAKIADLSGLQKEKFDLWDSTEMKDFFQKHAQWAQWRQAYRKEIERCIPGANLVPEFQMTIFRAARELGIDKDDLLACVDTYIDRNTRFHNDIEGLLKSCRFGEVALQMARDFESIDDDFPDDWTDSKRKSIKKMMTVLKNTYYESITPDGQSHVLSAEGIAMHEEYLRKTFARKASGSSA